MTNGGIIEGHTEYSGCSDLSLAIGYAGQHYYNESDILADCGDRQPFNPDVEKEAHFRSQHIILLGCCLGNTKGNAAACVLAGHHHPPSRNRIKAGHFTFGSGEFCMQMRVVSGGIKGPSEICATSLPILL